MVNLYDSPAQAHFVNTYVPIQFDGLYKLADKAERDTEKGQALMDDLSKYQELNSMSDVANDMWRKNIYSPIRDYVNENIKSSYDLQKPDVLAKLSEMRRGVIGSQLASKLMRNKQSLDDAYKNVSPELQNLYLRKFQLWDPTNPEMGVEVGKPIAYKSWEEAADPLFKDLKPRYIGNRDGYRVTAIPESDVKDVVASKESEIYSDPTLNTLAENDLINGKIPESYYNVDNATGQKSLSPDWKKRYIKDVVTSAGIDKTKGQSEEIDQIEKEKRAQDFELRITKYREDREDSRAAANRAAKAAARMGSHPNGVAMYTMLKKAEFGAQLASNAALNLIGKFDSPSGEKMLLSAPKYVQDHINARRKLSTLREGTKEYNAQYNVVKAGRDNFVAWSQDQIKRALAGGHSTYISRKEAENLSQWNPGDMYTDSYLTGIYGEKSKATVNGSVSNGLFNVSDGQLSFRSAETNYSKNRYAGEPIELLKNKAKSVPGGTKSVPLYNPSDGKIKNHSMSAYAASLLQSSMNGSSTKFQNSSIVSYNESDRARLSGNAYVKIPTELSGDKKIAWELIKKTYKTVKIKEKDAVSSDTYVEIPASVPIFEEGNESQDQITDGIVAKQFASKYSDNKYYKTEDNDSE